MVIDVNPFLVQLLGVSDDAFLGKKVWELGFFKDIAADEEKFAELQAQEYIHSENLQLETADGRRIEVEFVSNAYLVNEHKLIQFNIRDITERKKAEALLCEAKANLEVHVKQRTGELAGTIEKLQNEVAERLSAEQAFRSLADSMPQMVWATRPDGWNIYFNQQWVDYTGMTREESYGHGWNTPFHPDDKKRAWDAWQHATQHNTRYSLECRLRRADGAYRWWLVRGVPMLGANGEILKWFGTCTDIEDLKRTETALQEAKDLLEQRVAERTTELQASELRFRTLANAMPQLAWIARTDGFIFWYNQRWYDYTGTTPEQMEGWGWQSVHDPMELPTILDRWKSSLATGEPFEMTFPLRGADGIFRPFLTRGHPLKDAEGRVQQWFGTNTDISKYKETEQALLASEAHLRSLNDELDSRVVERTLELQVAIDSLQAEIINRRQLELEILKISDYEQSRIGQDLHDGTCQNLACIAVLAEAGLREINQENPQTATCLTEISQVARQSIDEVRRLATGLFPVKIEQHGLEWALRELAVETTVRRKAECTFKMHEPIEFTDNNAAAQIYRIAQEAVSNAVRHGQAQNITIELSKSKGNVSLFVQDDGIGLPPRRENMGGLGLHTMEYRAKLLGGSLHVGPAIGKGTSVACSFPEKELTHATEATSK